MFLNSELFQQFYHENGENFECLLLNTEVRWLSKGKYWSFCILFLTQFLNSSKIQILTLHDIAYWSNTFTKFNEINLTTASKLNQTYQVQISPLHFFFFCITELFKCNIAHCKHFLFPSLTEIEDNIPDWPSTILSTPGWSAQRHVWQVLGSIFCLRY